jgi:hypothetical protein
VTGWHIAQLNIARAVAPMDDERMAGFMGRLEEINALADRTPGFVWRLQGENGNNTALKVDPDPLVIVNFSIWESVEALHSYTYHSDHKSLFARRFDWFERWDGPSLVMWWQPAGTAPSIEEGLRRLRLLADHGPTAEAFTFKHRFAPPD